MNFSCILLLGAHPDDAEFGAGGSICRMATEGAEIHHAVFSPCIESLPEGMENDILFKELYRAVRHLGVERNHIHTYSIPVRHFPEYRQHILEELIILKKQIKPDLVVLPSSFDVHQDHQTLHHEGTRAFRHSSIIGYELPWNNLRFKHDLFIKLSDDHMQAKINALAEYRSQQKRYYADETFIRSLAKVRGTQVHAAFAEGFELIRWII